jgi:glutamine synthetase
LGVLMSKELSAGLTRRLSTTASRLMLRDSPNAHLNKQLLERYSRLQKDIDPKYVQATYVWIDGTGENVRCKDRVLEKTPQKPGDCPDWQYDGSSTYQAQGGNSDVSLVPRALYRDPFKAGDKDVIVLCDTYKPDGSPCESNHRAAMQAAYDQTKDQEPWFGIEQVRIMKSKRVAAH